MRHLTIYRRLFTKADCYTKGTRQTSRGIQVHSTGANNPFLHRYVQPDDGRLGKNKYNNSHNRAGLDVCASAYIGKLQDGTVAVYQTLPWDYRCWLSGKGNNGNANRMCYIGYEICEDGKEDSAYFRNAVMEAAVNLTAHLCTLFGVSPYTVLQSFSQGDALAVMDHRELHSRGLASNHGDILNWSKKHGVTMNDFRSAVDAAMREGVEVQYINCDTGSTEEELIPLFQAEVTCHGTYLNLRASKSKNSTSLYKLNRGTVVSVLDSSDPDWWRVQTDNGSVGYAMTRENGNVYLKPIPNNDGDVVINEIPDADLIGDFVDAGDAADDGVTQDMVEVSRAELAAVYAQIGKLLGV